MTDGPVKVVIDAQSLSSDAAGSGIARYTQSLIDALALLPEVELVALCAPSIALPAGVTPAGAPSPL
jgi:hypothetical protein